MAIPTEGSGGTLCDIITAVDASGFPGDTEFGVFMIFDKRAYAPDGRQFATICG